MTSPGRLMAPAIQPALFHHRADSVPVHPEVAERRTAVPEWTKRDRRDVFNGRLLAGLTVVQPYDIPAIDRCTLVPDRLVCFSEAVRMSSPDPLAWVHPYEDDYKAERFWSMPEKYFERLRGFAGVISPDYSLYRNMPTALQISNTYRNHLLGARMQSDGFNVITNVRLSGRESIPYALAGVPSHSTLALGLHGCTKSLENRPHVIEEVGIVCDYCEPTCLVVYGSPEYGVLTRPREMGIPVYVYRPDSHDRSTARRPA